MEKLIYLISFVILLLQYSCQQQPQQKNEINKTSSVAIKEKVLDETFVPPFVFFLSDMPKADYRKSSAKINTKNNKQDSTSFLSKGQTQFISESSHGYFEIYSTAQGLALSTVGCSYSDREGNLWFGTQGSGISKYNGKAFINYSVFHGLANTTVLSIAEDNFGNLWFGTDGGGVSKYDGISFTNYTEKNGLAGNTVRDILVDKKGTIWFATSGGGISMYEQKQQKDSKVLFKNLSIPQGLPSDNIRCIAEDKKGNLWLGTQENGLCKYDGVSFATYTTENGLAGNKVRSILEDNEGTLFIGTDDGGLSIYDTKLDVSSEINFKNLTSEHGLPGNSIRCLHQDKKGAIWIGTNNTGISKYQSVDGVAYFINYSTLNGMSSNTIMCIAEDKSNNLWFGTDGGGVDKYCGESFNNFTTQHGLANNLIWGITETKNGNLFFGTDDNGVCQVNTSMKPVSFFNFANADGLANNAIVCIKEDSKGNIWFGTNGAGVCKYDGTGFTNYTSKQGLSNDFILCITEDKFGNIWFGSATGVSKLSAQLNTISAKEELAFTNYNMKQGLANEIVSCITEDKEGNLWFGTLGGISRLKKGIVKEGESYFQDYTMTEGLAGNGVICIKEDRYRNLYIGTENGLSVLTVTHDHPEEIKINNYNKSNGLPNNSVTNVLQLPNGKIVLGTYNGIVVFNPELPLDKNEKLAALEVFNISTGYPIKDVNEQGSMLLDSKGIIWAGTGDEKIGLVRFDYNAVKRNLDPPKVVIENIKINEQEICWYSLLSKINNNSVLKDSIVISQQELITYGELPNLEEKNNLLEKYSQIKFDSVSPFYNVPQHLVLPYKHNQITIDFNCIDVSRHEVVNYQYMLEGYDKEWSPIFKKTEAIFGNMNEGEYVFKLKAQSPDGVWSAPITYSFKVLPPWYRTWWSYLLYLAIAIAGIRLLFKWRTKDLKRRGEHLKKIVKERTKEVEEEKKEVEKQKEEAEKQFKRSEELLLNILPEEIAEELKLTGKVAAKQFQAVTVLFTDFVNFTGISQTLSPQNLVSEVHHCYTAFDAIMENHGLEKIKTIGDAYLAVSGIPHGNINHAVNAVQAAQEIISFINQRKKEGGLFDIRIGLNSGPIVAGIVGVKKFAYDIWGDTVNTSARMEQNSVAGKINISGATFELIKTKFKCEHRGKIVAKNKGEIDMYFVD